MNTQPCYQVYLFGECKDYTCNYSHEKCRTSDCQDPYCGYHSKATGKIWVHYIKLGKVWRLLNKRKHVDLDKFYLEILGFQNVVVAIQSAYENTETIEDFISALKWIQQHVEFTNQFMTMFGYSIEYTNPHVPVDRVLNKIVKLFDDTDTSAFDKEMMSFFDGIDREIKLAWQFWTDKTGYKPFDGYEEEFPALVHQSTIQDELCV